MLSAGCAGEAPSQPTQPAVDSSGNPYAADFDNILSRTESDFVRSVLVDYEITHSEFEESIDRQVQCMKDAGLHPIIDGEGFRKRVALPAGEEDSEQARDCDLAWDDGITGLYFQLHDNPNKVRWEDMVVACLIHEGLVPEGTTGDHFEEMMSRAGTQVQMLSDGEYATLRQPTDPDPAFPNGFRPLSDDAHGCMVNPREVLLRSGGEEPKRRRRRRPFVGEKGVGPDIAPPENPDRESPNRCRLFGENGVECRLDPRGTIQRSGGEAL